MLSRGVVEALSLSISKYSLFFTKCLLILMAEDFVHAIMLCKRSRCGLNSLWDSQWFNRHQIRSKVRFCQVFNSLSIVGCLSLSEGICRKADYRLLTRSSIIESSNLGCSGYPPSSRVYLIPVSPRIGRLFNSLTS